MTQTHFLNIDLDIAGDGELGMLFAELEPFAYVLNPGAQPFATLELNDQPRTAEEAVAAFHKAVTSLSPEAKSMWEALTLRALNVGIQAGDHPHSAAFTFSTAALKLIGELGAQLVFTVYAPLQSG